MRVYEDIQAFDKPYNTIVTMGIFDGVHQGHQQLLRQICTRAHQVGGETVVVTFWPHPKQVLSPPQTAPIQLLTTFEEKTTMLSQLGIDHLLKIKFTKAFSQLSAEAFVQQVLVAWVGMTQLVVGHDHRFGKNRIGNTTLLRKLGLRNNFTVKEIAPTLTDGVQISSTKIRQLLLQGKVERAQAYLGRPYAIECTTLQPEKNGKPGLNLVLASMHSYKLIPADGCYVVQVVHPHGTENGMLRITRKHNIPNMELAISNCASTTRYTPNVYVKFKKNLH